MKPDHPASSARTAPPAPSRTGLAALTARLAEAAEAARAAQGLPAASAGPWPELRSAQRFRETWERLGAERQVQQARSRVPQNAGPLNPQRLMLETLALMGELSPHYLRRFMAHTETLLWLEEAQARLKASGTGKGGPAARSGKAPRARK